MRREELEGPADRTAGPLGWSASDARSLVLELAGDAPLVELVTIRQLRRKRIVRDGETRVELSLDEVDVVARSRVIDRFVELEAELVKGDEARLASLAEVFAADAALAPSTGSKFEAAMALVRPARRRRSARRRPGSTRRRRPSRDTERRRRRRPTPDARCRKRRPPRPRAERRASSPTTRSRAGRSSTSRSSPTTSDVVSEAVDEAVSADTRLVVGKTPGVTADDHIAEAGRKVMRFHLARMLAREAGTREGRDPEELHAMRVATRRQRAAWRVFGASFRLGRTKRYRNGLREIASRLGAVRDLDVLLEAADIYRADLPVSEQRALEPLLADWREHRDDARVLLIRELDSDGYQRWVDDYRDFVRTEGAARPARRADPAAPRPRHRGVADLGGVRAGPRLRAGPALGGCRDPPRAADRRQVAALHARVRARGARRRCRAAHRPGHRAAGPPRPDERRERLGLDGADLPRRARRGPVAARERLDRALPRQPGARGRPTAAHDRRAMARRGRRHLPADARPGRRRALGPPALGEPARRSRQAWPACSTARIVPSRRPASETRIRSAP